MAPSNAMPDNTSNSASKAVPNANPIAVPNASLNEVQPSVLATQPSVLSNSASNAFQSKDANPLPDGMQDLVSNADLNELCLLPRSLFECSPKCCSKFSPQSSPAGTQDSFRNQTEEEFQMHPKALLQMWHRLRSRVQPRTLRPTGCRSHSSKQFFKHLLVQVLAHFQTQRQTFRKYGSQQ